jgi:hypothetical protein
MGLLNGPFVLCPLRGNVGQIKFGGIVSYTLQGTNDN